MNKNCWIVEPKNIVSHKRLDLVKGFYTLEEAKAFADRLERDFDCFCEVYQQTDLQKDLEDYIEVQMSAETVAKLWNVYAEEKGFTDEIIYDISEIDDMYAGMSHREFLGILSSDFDVTEDYFYNSSFGLKTTNSVFDVIREDDLIGWIVEYAEAICKDFPELYTPCIKHGLIEA